jgi:hypothetical protein
VLFNGRRGGRFAFQPFGHFRLLENFMPRKTRSAQPTSSKDTSQVAETTLSESTELSAASGSDADVASVTTPATVKEGATAADLVPLLGVINDLVRGEDGRLKAVEREVTEADILSFRQSGDEIIVVTADGRRHALCAGDLT